MNVGLLIITHSEFGEASLKALRNALGKEPCLAINTINVFPEMDPDEIATLTHKRVQQLDNGAGVLILTDLYGATPSNIAQRMQDMHVRIICGLNLPMLVRIMNYPQLDLQQMAESAYNGGHAGIINCQCSTRKNRHVTQETSDTK